MKTYWFSYFIPEACIKKYSLAGLLAHPDFCDLPNRRVAVSGFAFQKLLTYLVRSGFTAAGTAPDSHRIPILRFVQNRTNPPRHVKGRIFLKKSF